MPETMRLEKSNLYDTIDDNYEFSEIWLQQCYVLIDVLIILLIAEPECILCLDCVWMCYSEFNLMYPLIIFWDTHIHYSWKSLTKYTCDTSCTLHKVCFLSYNFIKECVTTARRSSFPISYRKMSFLS